MFGHLTSAVGLILPEIVLLAAACVNLAVGPFLAGDAGQTPNGLRHRWGVWSLLSLLIAGWCSLLPVPVVESTQLAPARMNSRQACDSAESLSLIWFQLTSTKIAPVASVTSLTNQTSAST